MKLFCAFICVASVFADDDTGVEVKMRQQKVIQLLFEVFMFDRILIQSFIEERIYIILFGRERNQKNSGCTYCSYPYVCKMVSKTRQAK